MVDISAAPFVADIKPYIDVLVEAVVGAVVTLAAAKLNQWTNIKISGALFDKLQSAAKTQAGVMVAGAEDNLANTTVTVSNPVVAAAANKIAADFPHAAEAIGFTPDNLKHLIVGEIGKLQAQTPPATNDGAAK